MLKFKNLKKDQGKIAQEAIAGIIKVWRNQVDQRKLLENDDIPYDKLPSDIKHERNKINRAIGDQNHNINNEENKNNDDTFFDDFDDEDNDQDYMAWKDKRTTTVNIIHDNPNEPSIDNVTMQHNPNQIAATAISLWNTLKTQGFSQKELNAMINYPLSVIFSLSEVKIMACGFTEYAANILSIPGSNVASETAIKLFNSIIGRNQASFKKETVTDIFYIKSDLIRRNERMAIAKKQKYYAEMVDGWDNKFKLEDTTLEMNVNELRRKYHLAKDLIVSQTSKLINYFS